VCFWAAVAVVLVLMCLMGWRVDRKRKGGRGHRGDSVDARGNETMLHNHHIDGPFGGSSDGTVSGLDAQTGQLAAEVDAGGSLPGVQGV
jgi:hypothetical protein